MFVIRLSDGRLRVPRSAVSPDGSVIGEGYQEIGPTDPDYQRLSEQAITEEELADRRRVWREDDAALREEFLTWKSEQDARGSGNN